GAVRPAKSLPRQAGSGRRRRARRPPAGRWRSDHGYPAGRRPGQELPGDHEGREDLQEFAATLKPGDEDMASSRFLRAGMAASLAGLLLAACAGAPVTTDSVVTGTAMYRERMMLPEGSMFEARLIDVSRADAAAEVLGEVRFAAPAGPPIRFSIAYDAG